MLKDWELQRLLGLAVAEINRLDGELGALDGKLNHERGQRVEMRASLKRAHEREVADLKTQLETVMKAAAAAGARMVPLNPTVSDLSGAGIDLERETEEADRRWKEKGAQADEFLAQVAQEAEDGPVAADLRAKLADVVDKVLQEEFTPTLKVASPEETDGP